MSQPPVRFSAIGINHNHIYGMARLLLRAGAEFVSFYAPEPDLVAEFQQAFPQARLTSSAQEILQDPTIQMILTSGIASERAPLGIQVMKHGKDFMSDKPGFTTLEQLAEVRRVQAETKRIYSICFSERLEVRAAVQAGELIYAGAIGQVIQTVGLGPHRVNPPVRPDWYYQREKYGGILTDIASHQVEQFLYYTGSTSAQVVASQVANFNHPQFPGLEDFGDMVLRSAHATGYIRVDWFTPQGLGQWGDGRMTILGTDGYIELRKYIDIAGRPGGDHLFLVDQKGIRYLDCSQHDLPYGSNLVADVLNRTETAMPQAHVFLASQLALEAEAKATKLGNLQTV
jgi:predicted dehydrogenase